MKYYLISILISTVFVSCEISDNKTEKEEVTNIEHPIREAKLENNENNQVRYPITDKEIQTIWDSIEYKVKYYKNNAELYHNIDSMSSDFTDFYNKFISDSIFQIKNVVFPIIGYDAECDGESQKVTKENWQFLSFDIREDFYYELDSNLFFQNKNIFYYENNRKEIGNLAILGFEKINGEWKLVLFDFNPC